MKFYMLINEEKYCYANDLNRAYEIFAEENKGDEILLTDVIEIPWDTIVYCEEMYGIGDYDTIEIHQLKKDETEEYFGDENDIKDIIELSRFLYEGW